MPHRPALALLLLAGLSAQAQTLPDYTFGPAFGNGFNTGLPGLYAGGQGLQTNTMPGGFYQNAQNPFLTMPMPVYPTGFPAGISGNGATPLARSQAQRQALPYWMQTPQPLPPNARFVNSAAMTPHPANPTRPQAPPPRWVPLSGPLPVVRNQPQAGNSWRAAPVDTPRIAAQRPPATPPKWHTE